MDDKQRTLTLRRAKVLRDRLLSRAAPGNPHRDAEVNALAKLAILLAGEVPPHEADAILDALMPWVDAMQEDNAAALSEALVMRGRIEEAESIWLRISTIARMHAQMRCLAHRLIAASQAYGGTPALDAVVEVIVEGPVGTLAELAEHANDRNTALAVYAGSRLLQRTLETIREHTPALVNTLAKLTGPDEADESMIRAADRMVADSEGYDLTPQDVPSHLARDPIIGRIDEIVRSRLAPGRGRPNDPHGYVAMLREATYGSTM